MTPTPILEILDLLSTAAIAIVALCVILKAMHSIVQNKPAHRPERKP